MGVIITEIMKVKIANSFWKSLERIGSISDKWNEFHCWVRFHTKKDFLNIVKTLFHGYPWDKYHLLNVEKMKMIEMANYFERNKHFVGWEYVVRDIRLCVRLIDIINNEDTLFHFDGDLIFVDNENGEYEVQHTDDFKYICDVNVNTRNVDRFFTKDKQEWPLKHPHYLYVQKAKYLYHKIRLEHEDEWWD